MRHKIQTALFGNKWLKLLSLVIGFVIWVMVYNVNNPTRTVLFSGIPITIVNQDSVADIGKVIEPEGNGMVTVRVTAPRSAFPNRATPWFLLSARKQALSPLLLKVSLSATLPAISL